MKFRSSLQIYGFHLTTLYNITKFYFVGYKYYFTRGCSISLWRHLILSHESITCRVGKYPFLSIKKLVCYKNRYFAFSKSWLMIKKTQHRFLISSGLIFIILIIHSEKNLTPVSTEVSTFSTLIFFCSSAQRWTRDVTDQLVLDRFYSVKWMYLMHCSNLLWYTVH